MTIKSSEKVVNITFKKALFLDHAMDLSYKISKKKRNLILFI